MRNKHSIMDKKNVFSYILEQLIAWYTEVATEPRGYEHAFSKLTTLKLLFLVSAVPNGENNDLLDIFDKFYALPYGPVESDIYNSINELDIPNFTISDKGIQKEENVSVLVDSDTKKRIDSSVSELRRQNSTIVLCPAFKLVDITHKWESWNKAYEFAKFMGIQSSIMTASDIRTDRNKYYGV